MLFAVSVLRIRLIDGPVVKTQMERKIFRIAEQLPSGGNHRTDRILLPLILDEDIEQQLYSSNQFY